MALQKESKKSIHGIKKKAFGINIAFIAKD